MERYIGQAKQRKMFRKAKNEWEDYKRWNKEEGYKQFKDYQ